jgi:hypothetical protein
MPDVVWQQEGKGGRGKGEVGKEGRLYVGRLTT